jgi:hypothetical protein
MRGLLDDIKQYLGGEEGYKYAEVLPASRSPDGDLEFAVPNSVRQGLLELINAATLPGDVYAGRRDATVEDAANFGLSLLGGSSAVPKPDNALGMFGGRNALNVNKQALERFESGNALPSDSSRLDTKFFTGPAGETFFEIDDSKSFISPDAINRGKVVINEEGNVLSNIFRADDLYNAYPELADLPVFPTSEKAYLGTYQGLLGEAGSKMTLNPNLSPQEARKVILHEGGHAIQSFEDFPRGTNSNRMKNIVVDRMDQSARLARDKSVSPELEGLGGRNMFDVYLDLMNRAVGNERSPDMLYLKSAGEVAARNISDRANMSVDQRLRKEPARTEGIPFFGPFQKPVGKKILNDSAGVFFMDRSGNRVYPEDVLQDLTNEQNYGMNTGVLEFLRELYKNEAQ